MNGLTLPTPPEGYWATVPWWGYLAFLVVLAAIVVVIGPWMIQRARGAPSAMQSRERVLAEGLTALAKDQRQERDWLAGDRDRGWDVARGCLAVMHGLWHDLVNVTQERNNLLSLCQRMLDGKVPSDAVRDRLLDYAPRQPPDPLPDLDGVEPKKPGETKYA